MPNHLGLNVFDITEPKSTDLEYLGIVVATYYKKKLTHYGIGNELFLNYGISESGNRGFARKNYGRLLDESEQRTT